MAEEFPGHVAAAWLGHTEEIADAHYRQVLPGHFERAIIATTSKSETVHQTVHDAVQSTVQETVPHGVAVHRTELQTPHNHLTPCELAQKKAVACENMRPPILEAGGNCDHQIYKSHNQTTSWWLHGFRNFIDAQVRLLSDHLHQLSDH